MPRDRAGGGAVGDGLPLDPTIISSARDQAVWEVDTFALPVGIRGEGEAIVSTTLVMAGRYALGVSADSGLSNEPAAVAAAQATALRSAAAKVGAWPPRLRVRHADLVPELASLLADAPVRIECQVPLTYVPHARSDLVREMADGGGARSDEPSGGPHWPVAMPRTFDGWGLPDDVSAELIAAAAEYYRAAAWRWIGNVQMLYAEVAGGRQYACSILGNAGIEFGLQTSRVPEDIPRLAEGDHEHAFDLLAGPVVTLSFDAARDLPASYVRSIRRKGWAGPDARTVPLILAINTLAGGLPTEYARDLAALMRSLPHFVDAHRHLLLGEVACESWPVWRDEASGVQVSYRGHGRFAPVTHWSVPERLAPAIATGPAARPERALDEVWADTSPEDIPRIQAEVGSIVVPMVEVFRPWLGAAGLSARTADRYASGALRFLAWLYLARRTAIESVTEVDLRTFLYSRCPRDEETVGRSATDAIPASLRHLFGFLADARGLECPWAKAVLAEREAFDARRRTLPRSLRRPDVEEEWEFVLGADLSARVFLPDERLGSDDEWEPPSDPALRPLTGRLHWELTLRWLLWREEIVRAGMTDPELVRAALLPRQRAWERAPHPRLGGLSPIEAVQAERREEQGR